jgi:hypothetical protein
MFASAYGFSMTVPLLTFHMKCVISLEKLFQPHGSTLMFQVPGTYVLI